MRYVIFIVLIAVFVTWDVMQNDSRWLHKFGNFVQHMAAKIS